MFSYKFQFFQKTTQVLIFKKKMGNLKNQKKVIKVEKENPDSVMLSAGKMLICVSGIYLGFIMASIKLEDM